MPVSNETISRFFYIEKAQILRMLETDSSFALRSAVLCNQKLVARREFVENNPQAVSAFLDHYKASVEYVNDNAEEAAELVGQYDIVTAEVAREALPAGNITFVEGSGMKEKLSGYLSVLLEQNPKSVGGELPQDDFYYSRQE